MDYEDWAMESAIYPWLDEDLAGMELEKADWDDIEANAPWDDYRD